MTLVGTRNVHALGAPRVEPGVSKIISGGGLRLFGVGLPHPHRRRCVRKRVAAGFLVVQLGIAPGSRVDGTTRCREKAAKTYARWFRSWLCFGHCLGRWIRSPIRRHVGTTQLQRESLDLGRSSPPSLMHPIGTRALLPVR